MADPDLIGGQLKFRSDLFDSSALYLKDGILAYAGEQDTLYMSFPLPSTSIPIMCSIPLHENHSPIYLRGYPNRLGSARGK
jgi:hypothetical protein